jgi:hypothetical protein
LTIKPYTPLFRRWILAGILVLFLAITQGFLADTLIWWQQGDLAAKIVSPFFALVMFPIFSWLLPSMLCHALLREIRERPAGWVRLGVSLCLGLNLVAAAFLILVTFGSIRAFRSSQARILGYLVPNGRAVFTTSLDVRSVNNHHQGDLYLHWIAADGGEVASDIVPVSGGTSTEHNMAYGPTTLKQQLTLPGQFSSNMTLGWSINGTVMVFADPEKTEAHAGGPGGGFISVGVEYQPFNSEGSMLLPGRDYAFWLKPLLEAKEQNRLTIWLASLMLIFVNCAFLTTAGLNDSFDVDKNSAIRKEQTLKPPVSSIQSPPPSTAPNLFSPETPTDQTTTPPVHQAPSENQAVIKKTCPKCGAPVSPSHLYCTRCGTALRK